MEYGLQNERSGPGSFVGFRNLWIMSCYYRSGLVTGWRNSAVINLNFDVDNQNVKNNK